MLPHGGVVVGNVATTILLQALPLIYMHHAKISTSTTAGRKDMKKHLTLCLLLLLWPLSTISPMAGNGEFSLLSLPGQQPPLNNIFLSQEGTIIEWSTGREQPEEREQNCYTCKVSEKDIAFRG